MDAAMHRALNMVRSGTSVSRSAVRCKVSQSSLALEASQAAQHVFSSAELRVLSDTLQQLTELGWELNRDSVRVVVNIYLHMTGKQPTGDGLLSSDQVWSLWYTWFERHLHLGEPISRLPGQPTDEFLHLATETLQQRHLRSAGAPSDNAHDSFAVPAASVPSSIPATVAPESPAEEALYEVERICARRGGAHAGPAEFLIKWRGFDLSESSWEPEANLDCEELVRVFTTRWRQLSSRQRARLCKGTSMQDYVRLLGQAGAADGPARTVGPGGDAASSGELSVTSDQHLRTATSPAATLHQRRDSNSAAVHVVGDEAGGGVDGVQRPSAKRGRKLRPVRRKPGPSAPVAAMTTEATDSAAAAAEVAGFATFRAEDNHAPPAQENCVYTSAPVSTPPAEAGCRLPLVPPPRLIRMPRPSVPRPPPLTPRPSPVTSLLTAHPSTNHHPPPPPSFGISPPSPVRKRPNLMVSPSKSHLNLSRNDAANIAETSSQHSLTFGGSSPRVPAVGENFGGTGGSPLRIGGSEAGPSLNWRGKPLPVSAVRPTLSPVRPPPTLSTPSTLLPPSSPTTTPLPSSASSRSPLSSSATLTGGIKRRRPSANSDEECAVVKQAPPPLKKRRRVNDDLVLITDTMLQQRHLNSLKSHAVLDGEYKSRKSDRMSAGGKNAGLGDDKVRRVQCADDVAIIEDFRDSLTDSATRFKKVGQARTYSDLPQERPWSPERGHERAETREQLTPPISDDREFAVGSNAKGASTDVSRDASSTSDARIPDTDDDDETPEYNETSSKHISVHDQHVMSADKVPQTDESRHSSERLSSGEQAKQVTSGAEITTLASHVNTETLLSPTDRVIASSQQAKDSVDGSVSAVASSVASESGLASTRYAPSDLLKTTPTSMPVSPKLGLSSGSDDEFPGFTAGHLLHHLHVPRCQGGCHELNTGYCVGIPDEEVAEIAGEAVRDMERLWRREERREERRREEAERRERQEQERAERERELAQWRAHEERERERREAELEELRARLRADMDARDLAEKTRREVERQMSHQMNSDFDSNSESPAKSVEDRAPEQPANATTLPQKLPSVDALSHVTSSTPPAKRPAQSPPTPASARPRWRFKQAQVVLDRGAVAPLLPTHAVKKRRKRRRGAGDCFSMLKKRKPATKSMERRSSSVALTESFGVAPEGTITGDKAGEDTSAEGTRTEDTARRTEDTTTSTDTSPLKRTPSVQHESEGRDEVEGRREDALSSEEEEEEQQQFEDERPVIMVLPPVVQTFITGATKSRELDLDTNWGTVRVQVVPKIREKDGSLRELAKTTRKKIGITEEREFLHVQRVGDNVKYYLSNEAQPPRGAGRRRGRGRPPIGGVARPRPPVPPPPEHGGKDHRGISRGAFRPPPGDANAAAGDSGSGEEGSGGSLLPAHRRDVAEVASRQATSTGSSSVSLTTSSSSVVCAGGVTMTTAGTRPPGSSLLKSTAARGGRAAAAAAAVPSLSILQRLRLEEAAEAAASARRQAEQVVSSALLKDSSDSAAGDARLQGQEASGQFVSLEDDLRASSSSSSSDSDSGSESVSPERRTPSHRRTKRSDSGSSTPQNSVGNLAKQEQPSAFSNSAARCLETSDKIDSKPVEDQTNWKARDTQKVEDAGRPGAVLWEGGFPASGVLQTKAKCALSDSDSDTEVKRKEETIEREKEESGTKREGVEKEAVEAWREERQMNAGKPEATVPAQEQDMLNELTEGSTVAGMSFLERKAGMAEKQASSIAVHACVEAGAGSLNAAGSDQRTSGTGQLQAPLAVAISEEQQSTTSGTGPLSRLEGESLADNRGALDAVMASAELRTTSEVEMPPVRATIISRAPMDDNSSTMESKPTPAEEETSLGYNSPTGHVVGDVVAKGTTGTASEDTGPAGDSITSPVRILLGSDTRLAHNQQASLTSERKPAVAVASPDQTTNARSDTIAVTSDNQAVSLTLENRLAAALTSESQCTVSVASEHQSTDVKSDGQLTAGVTSHNISVSPLELGSPAEDPDEYSVIKASIGLAIETVVAASAEGDIATNEREAFEKNVPLNEQNYERSTLTGQLPKHGDLLAKPTQQQDEISVEATKQLNVADKETLGLVPETLEGTEDSGTIETSVVGAVEEKSVVERTGAMNPTSENITPEKIASGPKEANEPISGTLGDPLVKSNVRDALETNDTDPPDTCTGDNIGKSASTGHVVSAAAPVPVEDPVGVTPRSAIENLRAIESDVDLVTAADLSDRSTRSSSVDVAPPSHLQSALTAVEESVSLETAQSDSISASSQQHKQMSLFSPRSKASVLPPADDEGDSTTQSLFSPTSERSVLHRLELSVPGGQVARSLFSPRAEVGTFALLTQGGDATLSVEDGQSSKLTEIEVKSEERSAEPEEKEQSMPCHEAESEKTSGIKISSHAVAAEEVAANEESTSAVVKEDLSHIDSRSEIVPTKESPSRKFRPVDTFQLPDIVDNSDQHSESNKVTEADSMERSDAPHVSNDSSVTSDTNSAPPTVTMQSLEQAPSENVTIATPTTDMAVLTSVSDNLTIPTPTDISMGTAVPDGGITQVTVQIGGIETVLPLVNASSSPLDPATLGNIQIQLPDMSQLPVQTAENVTADEAQQNLAYTNTAGCYDSTIVDMGIDTVRTTAHPAEQQQVMASSHPVPAVVEAPPTETHVMSAEFEDFSLDAIVRDIAASEEVWADVEAPHHDQLQVPQNQIHIPEMLDAAPPRVMNAGEDADLFMDPAEAVGMLAMDSRAPQQQKSVTDWTADLLAPDKETQDLLGIPQQQQHSRQAQGAPTKNVMSPHKPVPVVKTRIKMQEKPGGMAQKTPKVIRLGSRQLAAALGTVRAGAQAVGSARPRLGVSTPSRIAGALDAASAAGVVMSTSGGQPGPRGLLSTTPTVTPTSRGSVTPSPSRRFVTVTPARGGRAVPVSGGSQPRTITIVRPGGAAASSAPGTVLLQAPGQKKFTFVRLQPNAQTKVPGTASQKATPAAATLTSRVISVGRADSGSVTRRAEEAGQAAVTPVRVRTRPPAVAERTRDSPAPAQTRVVRLLPPSPKKEVRIQPSLQMKEVDVQVPRTVVRRPPGSKLKVAISPGQFTQKQLLNPVICSNQSQLVKDSDVSVAHLIPSATTTSLNTRRASDEDLNNPSVDAILPSAVPPAGGSGSEEVTRRGSSDLEMLAQICATERRQLSVSSAANQSLLEDTASSAASKASGGSCPAAVTATSAAAGDGQSLRFVLSDGTAVVADISDLDLLDEELE